MLIPQLTIFSRHFHALVVDLFHQYSPEFYAKCHLAHWLLANCHSISYINDLKWINFHLAVFEAVVASCPVQQMAVKSIWKSCCPLNLENYTFGNCRSQNCDAFLFTFCHCKLFLNSRQSIQIFLLLIASFVNITPFL